MNETLIEADFIEINEDGSESISKEYIVAHGAIERVDKETQLEVDENRGNLYVEPRYNFASLARYMEMNVWHGRCVRLKANLVAGLGWDLVTDAEDKSEDVDYKRIKAFLDRPNENPEDTFTAICKKLMVDYYAFGNFFAEAVRNLKQEPVELYHARCMTMRRARKIRGGGYYQLPYGARTIHFSNWHIRKKDLRKNEILHFFNYDPIDDYYGVPDWIAAMADIVQDRGYVEYTLNLFRNQLLAKFLVIVEGGKLSNSAKQNIRKFLQGHTSIKNAGGTIVLESEDPNVKIRIEKLDHEFMSKDNAQGSIRAQSREVVLAAHGVPPRMVGVVVAGQLGGGGENEAQLKGFKETVIDPDQNALEEFLNGTLIRAFGEHKWRLKFNEFDTTTRGEDANYFEKALDPQKGWLKKNEVREKQGLSALDEFEDDQEGMNLAGKLAQIRKQYDLAINELSSTQDL